MFIVHSRGGRLVAWRQAESAPASATGTYAPRGKWSAVARGQSRAVSYARTADTTSGQQSLNAALLNNANAFGSHAITITGGPQSLAATLVTSLNSFGAHSLGLSSGASASAVWDYPLEAGHSAGDILRIIAAAVAGKVSISGNVVTFVGLDGSTFRVIGTVDGSGNRNSVTHDGNSS